MGGGGCDHKLWLRRRTFDISIMVVMNIYCCAEAFLYLYKFLHARLQSLLKYMSFIMTLILE